MGGRDTKTAILDVAQELIQMRGASGISYQHISDAVRIRKASIHYHFATKETLIEAVLDRYSARFLEKVDALFASADPAPTKLKKYVALFETTLREWPGGKVCLCGMLGAELANLSSPSVGRLKQFYRENAERLAKVLEDGRKAGTLDFEGEPKALGMTIFALLEGVMLVARADGGLRTFRSVRDQLFRLVGA